MTDKKMNEKLDDHLMTNAAGGADDSVAPPKYKVGERVIFATWENLETHGVITEVKRSDWQSIPGQEWLYTIHTDEGSTEYQFEMDIHPE